MVGGVIAIFYGLALAGLAWESLWPRGTSPGVSPQQLLTHWVVGCLLVGGVLLVGGARAPGAALVGSSFCSFLAFLLNRLYGGENLETLVHGAVILGSVGLVGFGLAGLRGAAGEVRRRQALAEGFRVPRVLVRAPLGRYPMALALAFGTVVVGALLILWIQTGGWRGFANQLDAVHGFEDPWVQPLLAFNVAFLALLSLVEAWQASRSSGKEEAGDGLMSAVWGRVIDSLARGGPPVHRCLLRCRQGQGPSFPDSLRPSNSDSRKSRLDSQPCRSTLRVQLMPEKGKPQISYKTRAPSPPFELPSRIHFSA